MPKKDTNNYNKNYFTTRGIPQPGAETVTSEEKQKLAQSQQQAQNEQAQHGTPTGPDEDAEIRRAMGRSSGPQDGGE